MTKTKFCKKIFFIKILIEGESPVYKSNQSSKIIGLLFDQIRDDYCLTQVSLKQEEEKKKLSHL
jgi:hypothetical protein